jgi:hypothetical protein
MLYAMLWAQNTGARIAKNILAAIKRGNLGMNPADCRLQNIGSNWRCCIDED